MIKILCYELYQFMTKLKSSKKNEIELLRASLNYSKKYGMLHANESLESFNIKDCQTTESDLLPGE